MGLGLVCTFAFVTSIVCYSAADGTDHLKVRCRGPDAAVLVPQVLLAPGGHGVAPQRVQEGACQTYLLSAPIRLLLRILHGLDTVVPVGVVGALVVFAQANRQDAALHVGQLDPQVGQTGEEGKVEEESVKCRADTGQLLDVGVAAGDQRRLALVLDLVFLLHRLLFQDPIALHETLQLGELEAVTEGGAGPVGDEEDGARVADTVTGS